MRILWFGVNAGVVRSFTLESQLAQGLALMGDDVVRVSCDGVFSTFCPVMQGALLLGNSPTRDKQAVCRSCTSISRAASDGSVYRTVRFEDFMHGDDISEIDELLESVTVDNWSNFEVEDVPIGRYATYLSMLSHKVPNVTATPEAWRDYRIDMKNALLTQRVAPRIFDAVNPSHALVYNPLYPSNRAFTETALRRDVRLIAISAGGYVPNRFRTLAIYPHLAASQTSVDSASIDQSLSVPCSREEVAAVRLHLSALIAGNDPWVYSSAPTRVDTPSIRRALGVREEASVVLALVASPDETRSSALVDAEYERVPADQLSDVTEFVTVAIDLASRNPDIDVVIRLHPRLAPNKRENITSPDLAQLQILLDVAPPNIKVNTPGDGIGLYDVMRITTAGLNQSSSAGLELLALGIPVVHYDPPRINAYPPNLGRLARRGDPTELDHAIREALEGAESQNSSVAAFRWLAVTLARSLVHKDSLTADQESPSSTAMRQPEKRQLRQLIPAAIRKRIARWVGLREDKRMVRPTTEVEPWLVEARERIVDLAPGPVWNPLTRVRGESLTDDRSQIEAAVLVLKQEIGWESTNH